MVTGHWIVAPSDLSNLEATCPQVQGVHCQFPDFGKQNKRPCGGHILQVSDPAGQRRVSSLSMLQTHLQIACPLSQLAVLLLSPIYCLWASATNPLISLSIWRQPQQHVGELGGSGLSRLQRPALLLNCILARLLPLLEEVAWMALGKVAPPAPQGCC